MANPYLRYLKNPLVLLVLIFSIAGATASGISTVYTDAELSEGAKDFRSLCASISSIALSLFVIVGLSGIKKQSHQLHNDLAATIITDREPLITEAEREFGATASSAQLANAGVSLSLASCLINITSAATTFIYNKTNNTKFIQPAWLLTILVISNLANLIGFVLFNTLGPRNGELTARLLAARNEEIEILKTERAPQARPVLAGLPLDAEPVLPRADLTPRTAINPLHIEAAEGTTDAADTFAPNT